MIKTFDVTIIGGGHAGLEAAWAAAQFDLNVAIVTMPGVPIASAPCNPAIGGVGKGQVVRELDALGGVMSRLADMSAIQCRVLNESKGYAVQSTRFQIDKVVYAEQAEKLVNENGNITVIREKVLKVEEKNTFVIYTSQGVYQSAKVIVTTGTFLNGRMHTGSEQSVGGRVDCQTSDGLGDIFENISVLKKRFKTGTPARIRRSSIDFSKMVSQKSDDQAECFHFANKPSYRPLEQVSCHITHTNTGTLDIIRKNKESSPIFNGQIKGVGPRYCPSIEDKAYRYEDRNIHHVFVEPESHSLDTFYPNGISTSLPREIQLDFIRTIEGLENAEIEVWGYAVEYDVVDTTTLDLTLQSKELPGLYFAGQVNGTSGYEEAAGQGLVAGLNAGLAILGRERLILDRKISYIGVLVEDLVSNKRDEPYRLFTARSENRLFTREDNTILRLASARLSLGLNSDLDKYINNFLTEFDLLMDFIRSYTYKNNQKNQAYFREMNLGPLDTNIKMNELIKRAQLNPIETLRTEFIKNGMVVNERLLRCLAISIKYEGYIDRAAIENARVDRMAKKTISWKSIVDSENVSFECKQRIIEIEPETFGQLQRIVGIRPATLAFVAGNMI